MQSLQEAESLERSILNEHGVTGPWHTEIRHNTFSGEWYVWAWRGNNTDEDADNGYRLKFRIEWDRLVHGLTEELAPPRKEQPTLW